MLGSRAVTVVSRRCQSTVKTLKHPYFGEYKPKPVNPDVHPRYYKLKETQKRFQEDNGLLIHRRGGTMDTIQWYGTVALAVACMALSIDFWYRQAYKGRK